MDPIDWTSEPELRLNPDALPGGAGWTWLYVETRSSLGLYHGVQIGGYAGPASQALISAVCSPCRGGGGSAPTPPFAERKPGPSTDTS